MQLYPKLQDESPQGIFEWLKFVVRARKDDVQEWNNLPNVFMAGRKVGKIPSASNDVAATDRIGDFNYDADYIYILVDDTGAAWRRATLGAW